MEIWFKIVLFTVVNKIHLKYYFITIHFFLKHFSYLESLKNTFCKPIFPLVFSRIKYFKSMSNYVQKKIK